MLRLGYIRVSTADQRPDRQILGLQGLVDELHIEYLSAVARHRPVYDGVIARLGSGDQFVVWAVDRAFRSLRDAINEFDALRARGIKFKIASTHLDMETADGRHQYNIMSANAEWERDKLIERTKEGIEAARARGVKIGRPPKLSPVALFDAHCRVLAGEPTAKIAAEHNIWPWTLTRALRRSIEQAPN